MNSYLLIENDVKTQEEHARAFAEDLHINSLDITIISAKESDKQKDETSEKRLKGISLIRDIFKKIHLTPLRGTEKALIILEADGLSIPAQNALLKTLEEPPPHTKIILTSENRHLLLPTIISRCLVLTNTSPAKKTLGENHEDLSVFNLPQTISEALKTAESLSKDKGKAIRTLEREMEILRNKLSLAVSENESEEIKNYTAHLAEYLETHKIIKTTNANLRLSLEHLYLSGYRKKTKRNKT